MLFCSTTFIGQCSSVTLTLDVGHHRSIEIARAFSYLRCSEHPISSACSALVSQCLLMAAFRILCVYFFCMKDKEPSFKARSASQVLTQFPLTRPIGLVSPPSSFCRACGANIAISHNNMNYCACVSTYFGGFIYLCVYLFIFSARITARCHTLQSHATHIRNGMITLTYPKRDYYEKKIGQNN